MIYYGKEDLKDLKGYTLIMPSVSVGNVGQLTIDLLISSLPTKKLGVIHHPAILPLAGGDPYDPLTPVVTTSADLHVSTQHRLAILQIRAPLIKSKRGQFLEELGVWCGEVGILEVVVAASCSAMERWDSQMCGPQLRYYTRNVGPEALQALSSVGVKELEERTDEFGKKHRFLSGSGFVQQFMDLCPLPVTCLIKFVDEGDNRQDAYILASCLNAWKNLFDSSTPSWRPPFSWRNLFGGPQPMSLY